MKGSQKVLLPTLMTLMYRYLLSIALCKRLCTGSYRKCCPANMNELKEILEKLYSERAENEYVHTKSMDYILGLNYLTTLFLKFVLNSRWSSNFTSEKAKIHIRNQLLSCSKHHTICKQISFCTMAAFGYFCLKSI